MKTFIIITICVISWSIMSSCVNQCQCPHDDVAFMYYGYMIYLDKGSLNKDLSGENYITREEIEKMMENQEKEIY